MSKYERNFVFTWNVDVFPIIDDCGCVEDFVDCMDIDYESQPVSHYTLDKFTCGSCKEFIERIKMIPTITQPHQPSTIFGDEIKRNPCKHTFILQCIDKSKSFSYRAMKSLIIHVGCITWCLHHDHVIRVDGMHFNQEKCMIFSRLFSDVHHNINDNIDAPLQLNVDLKMDECILTNCVFQDGCFQTLIENIVERSHTIKKLHIVSCKIHGWINRESDGRHYSSKNLLNYSGVGDQVNCVDSMCCSPSLKHLELIDNNLPVFFLVYITSKIMRENTLMDVFILKEASKSAYTFCLSMLDFRENGETTNINIPSDHHSSVSYVRAWNLLFHQFIMQQRKRKYYYGHNNNYQKYGSMMHLELRVGLFTKNALESILEVTKGSKSHHEHIGNEERIKSQHFVVDTSRGDRCLVGQINKNLLV